jgi:hypothetical protein
MTHSAGHFELEVESIVCGAIMDVALRLQISVGAGGVVGVCGPRTGNSSGVWPGNSSGRCGSPGSCTGGGISGCGFPGGLSGGSSVGCPGWIGGSSVGLIGIISPPFVATP